ncbi:MAG: GTP 3',8-cyclase MoaA [Eubacterium sp.]|nr:GTP 3',8-cyclase MoaA [Eubacterium sp.]
MIDGCGRKIDYIRISVTDRCNLRCMYCMPEEGVEMVSHEEILSFDEIVHVVRILSKLGFEKVKITGGEPLVRKNLKALIKDIKAVEGIKNVTLTTNGVLLKDQIEGLAAAGLDAVNVSIDTLNPEVFKKITRRDELEKVKAGIKETLKYKSVALKLNCVPFNMEGQNLWELTDYAKNEGIHVRYIEMMPIGFGKEYGCLKEDEIVSLLETKIGKLEPYKGKLGNGPCHYYSAESYDGKIGFISAVSHKFCGDCNRVRLTATGFLKNCLQFEYGSDIKTPLRSGASDDELLSLIRETIMNKPKGHKFTENNISEENNHIMSQIGG